jgi:hypothetical protein
MHASNVVEVPRSYLSCYRELSSLYFTMKCQKTRTAYDGHISMRIAIFGLIDIYVSSMLRPTRKVS